MSDPISQDGNADSKRPKIAKNITSSLNDRVKCSGESQEGTNLVADALRRSEAC